MFEPAWKRLVENLKARDFESRYLDRLWERIGPATIHGGGRDGLEREILEEMAYALHRAEDKLNFALLEVDLARHLFDENRNPAYETELIEQYERKRGAAMRARWEFQVHREAIGLVSHDVLESLYPIPGRLLLSNSSSPPTCQQADG